MGPKGLIASRKASCVLYVCISLGMRIHRYLHPLGSYVGVLHLSVGLHGLLVLLNAVSLHPRHLHTHLLQDVACEEVDTTIAGLAGHLWKRESKEEGGEGGKEQVIIGCS